ncbi:MAG: hypothetical protein KME27_27480 [Lyngbya sp. HA4199-MV5]|jgi:hypothetical protein|nr:hypothetical protein [Lyngbya sp. HA4199-MV5]
MSKLPDTNLGLATGLKYWLVFMLGLAVLGYGPILSITFGAIGGIASGIIAAWLKPKEIYVPKTAEPRVKETPEGKAEQTVDEPVRRARFRKYGAPAVQRQHQSRANRRFGWLFRRKL